LAGPFYYQVLKGAQKDPIKTTPKDASPQSKAVNFNLRIQTSGWVAYARTEGEYCSQPSLPIRPPQPKNPPQVNNNFKDHWHLPLPLAIIMRNENHQSITTEFFFRDSLPVSDF